jgi:hypothetical protein
MEGGLQGKTNSNGKQNLKWKTKPPMEDNIHGKTKSNGRQHLIEDNLKILKVKYLGNHFFDHAQTLALCLNDQTIFLQILKMKTTYNRRRPQVQR